MMNQRILCRLLWGLAAMYSIGAVASESSADCRVGEGAYPTVDPIFESFASEQHIPGMIYGIVRGGQLIHCRALGVGQVDSGQSVTIDTVFRIASMTKSFTALAVLKLRDAGKLSLDDTASRWVPQLGKGARPDADITKIRVSELLAHTAGFVTDDPWADRQLAMPEAEFTKMISAGIPMVRAPGVGFEYSNYGYALLGRIVGNASGIRYQDYVRTQILQPLGMKSSGWQASDIDAKRRAHGYRYEDGAWREEPVLADGAFAAIGGLHTSARDYVAYVGFLLSAWRDRDAADSPILSRQSRRQLALASSHPGLSAARPADPSSCATAGVYGLGMGIYKDCRFDLAVNHSGGLPGYGSYVLLLPDYDVGIFAFANRTYAGVAAPIGRAAARLFDLGVLQKKPAVAPGEALERIKPIVLKMYATGSVRTEPTALADNLLLDRSAEKRDAELRVARTALGECRDGASMSVRHTLSAVMRFPCERGTLAATVVLAPTPTPAVQTLRFAVEQ